MAKPDARQDARWGFLRWLLVPSLAGVEEFDAAPTTERRRIKKFWSDNPNLVRSSAAEPGTLRFFQEVDEARHVSHWPLYELVPFAQTKGLRVLEVGCGLGSDAAEFARGGAEYIGIDLTEPAVALTRRKLKAYGLPGNTVQADAERLPFRDRSFGMAYSWGVIHHTPDTQRCVDEMGRVLQPDGRLILMLYHSHGWWYYRIRLHWALLSLLRFRVSAALAQRLLGVKRDRVERWIALYKRDRRGLFNRFVARETDAGPRGVNPHSKVYNKEEARRLVGHLVQVHMQAAHWIELPSLERLLGRRWYRRLLGWLGSVNGPCLYVFARKPAGGLSTSPPPPANAANGSERGSEPFAGLPL